MDSPLGPRQLNRYLDLAAKRNWRLALLAARRLELDESVCESDIYLQPQGAGAPPHFLWQDVHGLLAAFNHHLAQEFTEYLEVLGLGHFSWAGVGNPFIDQSAAAELRSLYGALRPLFASPGVSCRLTPDVFRQDGDEAPSGPRRSNSPRCLTKICSRRRPV